MKKLKRYICVMAHPHRMLYIRTPSANYSATETELEHSRLSTILSYIIVIILFAVFIVVA